MSHVLLNIIVNDRTGKRASRSPITAAVGLTKTNTLSVWDRITGTSFLVDTGTGVCVFPASSNDKRKRTPTENLTAANCSKTNTWGQRRATNRPGMAGRVQELMSGVPCPGLSHFCPGIY